MAKRSQKGKQQYTNPTRAAIAKTTGIADSGSRVAASRRISRDSMLRQQSPTFRVNNAGFKTRLGGGPKDTVRITRLKKNDNIVTRHRADMKDPNTGFGMNVQTRIKHYKVTFS